MSTAASTTYSFRAEASLTHSTKTMFQSAMAAVASGATRRFAGRTELTWFVQCDLRTKRRELVGDVGIEQPT
jgi:hypothetical protein